MTMKLSGSHVSSSLTLTCVPKNIVTTFTDNILKVFSFNRIDLKTYPEDLKVPANAILYELNHTYRCYNDLTEEGPFDKGSSVLLTDFYKLYKKNASGNVLEDPSVPDTWIREPDPTWNTSVTIVKSKTTSTIVRFNSEPTDYQSYPDGTNSQELGFMEHPYPYKMRTTSVLNCITEPDSIVPNVTLNLDTLEIPWVPNESYTIEVTDSFVKHSYGEQYGSPAFTTAFISNQPPYMVSWEPNNAPETGNIQQARLTYIRRIKKGTANIQLFKAPATLVKNFTPTDPDVEILNAIPQGENEPASIIVSINVREYLEANQSYYILVDEGAFKDYDNFSNVAITDTNTITFSATMQNYIDWLPGAVTATNNNRYVKLIYPYYAEPNPNSSGTIRFYDSDNTLLKTFLSTGSDVTFEPTSPSLPDYPYSTTITFDVLGLLAEDKTYYMVVDTGVFQDADEFGNISIEDVNELRFSTDSINFPGLKSSISMFSALNDIGLRLRRNSIFANVVASLSAMGSRFKVAFSNQTSSFTISPVLLRLRRFIPSLSSSVTVSMNSTNSRKRGFRGAFSSAFTLPIARFIDFILINPSSSITDPTTTNYTYQYDPRNNGFAADVKNTASYIASSAPYEWVFQPSYIAASNNVFGRGKVYVYNSSDNSLAISFTNPDPAPGFDMRGGAYPGVENVNKFHTFGGKIAIYGDLIIISAQYWASTSNYELLDKIFVYRISTGALQASWSLPSQQPQVTLQDINEISCNGTHIVITTKIGYYIYQVSDYSLVRYDSAATFCTGRLYGNYFVYNSRLTTQWTISVYNMTTQTVLYGKNIAQVGPGWTANSDKLFLSKWDGTTDGQYINVYNLSTGVLINTIDKHQGEYLRINGEVQDNLMYLEPAIYFATASTVFAVVDVYPTTQGAIIGIFGYNISTGLLTHAITSYGYGSISGNQLVLTDDSYQATPSSPYGRLLRYTVPN